MSKLTVIERVARAIYEKEIEDRTIVGIPFENMDIHFKSAARAAIQAMREPTEEMLDAGAYDLGMELKDQYQNMIDKALEE